MGEHVEQPRDGAERDESAGHAREVEPPTPAGRRSSRIRQSNLTAVRPRATPAAHAATRRAPRPSRTPARRRPAALGRRERAARRAARSPLGRHIRFAAQGRRVDAAAQHVDIGHVGERRRIDRVVDRHDRVRGQRRPIRKHGRQHAIANSPRAAHGAHQAVDIRLDHHGRRPRVLAKRGSGSLTASELSVPLRRWKCVARNTGTARRRLERARATRRLARPSASRNRCR